MTKADQTTELIADLTTKLSRYEAMMAEVTLVEINLTRSFIRCRDGKWRRYSLDVSIEDFYPSPLEAFEALQKERV